MYPGVYIASVEESSNYFDPESFIVRDGPQTVVIRSTMSQQSPLSINNPGTKTYGDESFAISTTGGSGSGAVTYEVISGSNVITLK